MHVLVTGAAGMIGRKLVARLAREGLGGRAVERLSLVDVAPPEAPTGFGGDVVAWGADLAAPGEAARCAAGRPDVLFHLAAIVSGQAEAEFGLGYAVNLDATRALLEAVRAERRESGREGGQERGEYCPRLVFASSLAVYGAPFPGAIPDDFALTPLTSYGTQKAIGELLLADYSRRGFLDGVGIRLPTICIRPGAPNRAASGFFSGILREPLAGREAVLPVADSVRHWHASPRAAVGFLLHAATMDTAPLGVRRSLAMPGLSATVGEQIEALRRVAGEAAVRLIRREPDPAVARIVAGWPERLDPQRALALGFRAEGSFEEIIRAHVEDELGGRIGG